MAEIVKSSLALKGSKTVFSASRGIKDFSRGT
jgi:hypothetical protein